METHMPDWPGDGDIDLSIHDLPHKSSTTEWWYIHSHIQTTNGRNFGLFVSFFRHALSLDKKKGEYNYSHSILWGLSDLDHKKYYTRSLVDKRAPQIGLAQYKKGQGTKDPFIRKATMEMLKKGVVPYPDELLKNDPYIPWNKLDLQYDGQSYKKLKDGSYQLKLIHEKEEIFISLNLTPLIKPVRHGDNGVIYNSAVEDMFYYFIPKCRVTGTLRLKGEKLKIENSAGWYDHEFGARPSHKKSITKKDVAWNWLGVQLDNGHVLSVFDVHTRKKVKDKSAYLLWIDPNGNKSKTLDYSFDSFGTKWTSTRTFNSYPTQWKIVSNEFQLDLVFEAAFGNQEFGTVVSKPAFWEGRLNVTGTFKGKKITGKAYLERHGHIDTDSIPSFLKAVSKATLNSVKQVIPLHPDTSKMEELVSKKGNSNFIQNLDRQIIKQKLIRPIREIVDRGGKSWRSYATVACCDAVGGNSQEEIDWLSLPELIHVGSLIVDDVQDKSEIRRGGPTAHKSHGEAIAINSGSAAYFLGQICIYKSKQSDEKKLQIYSWYFEAMRASHSGQALDIYGLDYLMPQVLADNNFAKKLPEKLISIHRLKSAAPASYLARIGACLGNGSEAQIKALADFFEALGISFQIIDDVLNLKGFKDNNKSHAEDLAAGKITYPVAVAMSLMSVKDKKKLWEIIRQRTNDPILLGQAIDLINKYQALEISEKSARRRLETAWRKLDPLIENSMVKINLRAFSWFVLERTY